LIPKLNVRPYAKNFILSPDTGEFIIDKIASISRTLITFEINDLWIDKRFVSLIKSKPNLRYNIIISGETDQVRIKNIKQLSPTKIGYIVNEFIDSKKINELNTLKPHNVYLIYKRLPESFEIDLIKNKSIRELTILLDLPAMEEFLGIFDLFEDIRITIKPLCTESLRLLLQKLPPNKTIRIIVDSRIISPKDISGLILNDTKNRFVYETSSNTYYENFLNFIKSEADELNIYYREETPKRDTIFDWISKTDP